MTGAAGLRGMARALIRAVCDSFALHRSFLVRAYAGAIAVCGIIAVVPFLLGRSPLYCYTDLPGDGPFGGVMTAVSGFGLASAGALLFVASRYLDDRHALAWWVAIVGCVWLAMDETLMWHEAINDWLDGAGVPRFLGFADRDMYVFAAYGLVAGIVGWRLWPTIMAHPGALFPLAASVAFFGLSELADMPRWDTLSRVEKGLLGPFEEIAKTLGVLSIMLYPMLLIDGLMHGPAVVRQRRDESPRPHPGRVGAAEGSFGGGSGRATRPD